MSHNIKTKNPVRTQTVGDTIGERRLHQKFQFQPAAVKAKSLSWHLVDQFSKSPRKPDNIGTFTANATYKSARRWSLGAPFKRPLHHILEDGKSSQVMREVHKVAAIGPPPDEKIIPWLDKIISDERLWNPTAIRQAVQRQPYQNTGTPVSPGKTAQSRKPLK